MIALGWSVANEALFRSAEQHGARVISVSSLLLQTAKQIPRLKNLLVKRGRQDIRLIVGGAPFRVDPVPHIVQDTLPWGAFIGPCEHFLPRVTDLDVAGFLVGARSM